MEHMSSGDAPFRRGGPLHGFSPVEAEEPRIRAFAASLYHAFGIESVEEAAGVVVGKLATGEWAAVRKASREYEWVVLPPDHKPERNSVHPRRNVIINNPPDPEVLHKAWRWLVKHQLSSDAVKQELSRGAALAAEIADCANNKNTEGD